MTKRRQIYMDDIPTLSLGHRLSGEQVTDLTVRGTMPSPTTSSQPDGECKKPPSHQDSVWKGNSLLCQDVNTFSNSNSPSTNGDHVKSKYLPELPAFIQTRMPVGKNCFTGCVKKQHKDVTVYLLDADLWKNFWQVGTEMIITKKGRRVFPVPSYVICDLDPNKLYNVTLEIVSVDNAVYKYVNGEWVPFREGGHTYPSPIPGRETYLHPYSPNTGIHWMSEQISFAGMKISNNLEAAGTIVLQSMRKYQMKLIISELGGSMEVHIPQPETHFVAVTQYQNDKVTQMKIENNPFANGFKFSAGKSKDRSSQSASQDGDTEEENDSCGHGASSQTQQRPTKAGSRTSPRPVNRHTDYLMKKWATFKSILPNCMDLPYHDAGKPEETRPSDLGLRFDFNNPRNKERLTPNFLQPHGTTPLLDELYYSSQDQYNLHKAFSTGDFMCLSGDGNALAHVRHLAEINKMTNGIEKPLSLVTKGRSNGHEDRTEKKNSHGNQESNSCTTNAGTDGVRKRKRVSDFCDFAMQPDSKSCENGKDLAYYSQSDKMTQSRRRSDLKAHWVGEQDGRGLPAPKDLTLKSKSDLPHGNGPSHTLRPKVSLKNGDLWATTHEVVISTEGRPMFPYIILTVSDLEPLNQYSIDVRLTPASRWLYEYSETEWTPCLETADDPVVTQYQHPDSPKSGQEWGSDISFDRLRLSTTRQGKNMIKLQLRRQYYPVVTISTIDHCWTYPLKDAMFITVSIDRSTFLETNGKEKDYGGCPDYERGSTASEHLLRLSNRKQTHPKKARMEYHSPGTVHENKDSYDEGQDVNSCPRLTSRIQCSHSQETCSASNTRNTQSISYSNEMSSFQNNEVTQVNITQPYIYSDNYGQRPYGISTSEKIGLFSSGGGSLEDITPNKASKSNPLCGSVIYVKSEPDG